MVASLSLAHLLLCRSRVLEFCRCGFVWISDQSADCVVFHAGTQHDSGSRPHGAVRRLWNARHRLDAVLPARAPTWADLEGWACKIQFLGDQYRFAVNGS